MTHNQNLSTQQLSSGQLPVRMLYGAAIALLFIGLFLLGTESKPEWSPYWIIRPLVIVPLAGALGGAFFYYTGIPRSKGGLTKALAILLSLIGYGVIVWLGIVLGLDETLWD